MPKLYSARDIIKILGKMGFVEVSQRGSNIKMKGIYEGIMRIVIIPNHKTIAKGTFNSILKQAGLTKAEFEGLLN